jgi:E3 Ubiquitin ligase
MAGDTLVKFCLAAAALAVATVYSFFCCFRAWRKNRLVEDTPTSRVRSAAQGYVEFTGIGMMLDGASIKAPLSGIPCTWWSYKIEERGSSQRSRWSTIMSDTSADPFILDDGTGQCLVDPRGADVYSNVNHVWYGESEWPQGYVPGGPGLGGWLTAALAGAWSGGRYRYTEHRLQSREPLYAIGAFRSPGGVGVANPEAATAELLRDWKHDQKALLQRFDADHDGVLGAAEWEVARAAAREQVLSDVSTHPPAPGLSVLAKPTDGRAFLLAASDEESLARRLRRRALAAMALFIGGSAVLTWMLTRVW